MPLEYFWGGGMWIFPTIAMLIGLAVLLIVIFLIFGRGFRPPWQDPGKHPGEEQGSETAMEILKKRYAKGEITREDFEQMKKDIMS
jgi:putative membrane protein